MATKKKRVAEAEELNLVPIMNLVTILIPFLLMAVQFVTLAVIDTTLPALSDQPTEAQEEDDEEKLQLSIGITSEGFLIGGAAHVLADEAGEFDEDEARVSCTVEGCPTPDSYDTEELVRLLHILKDRHPDEENVILVPESRIPYEVLVMTMDATRDDPNRLVEGRARLLFPYVVIAAGTEG